MAINVSTDSPEQFTQKLAEKTGTVKQAAPGGFVYVKVQWEKKSAKPLTADVVRMVIRQTIDGTETQFRSETPKASSVPISQIVLEQESGLLTRTKREGWIRVRFSKKDKIETAISCIRGMMSKRCGDSVKLVANNLNGPLTVLHPVKTDI